MTVSVELFGQLTPQLARHLSLDLAPQTTIREAVLTLGLDPEEIGFITINGVQSDLQDLVPPDCRLCFFPYVTGG